MKKTLFLCLFSLVSTIGAMAQKTTVKIQDTQARLLDMKSNGYVKPLTVELKVDDSKGRIRDTWPLTKDQVEIEMKGDIANIRSYAVYMSSKKHNADVIVAATFNFKTSDNGEGYEMEVVGFPASFINWKTATQQDYEWIQMEKVQTTSERDKINAIIK